MLSVIRGFLGEDALLSASITRWQRPFRMGMARAGKENIHNIRAARTYVSKNNTALVHRNHANTRTYQIAFSGRWK